MPIICHFKYYFLPKEPSAANNSYLKLSVRCRLSLFTVAFYSFIVDKPTVVCFAVVVLCPLSMNFHQKIALEGVCNEQTGQATPEDSSTKSCLCPRKVIGSMSCLEGEAVSAV